MIWLFHRGGEYLSCEARTCMEDAGYELLIARPGRVDREWYPDEEQLAQRWGNVNRELRRQGWGDLYQGRR
jgi:hypothetical protein